MSDLILARRSEQVFEITLNRPAERNAINDEMMSAISGAFDQAEREFNDGARAVLVRGAGRVFSSGIDLSQFQTLDDGLRANLFPFTARYQAVFDKIERCSLPVICLLHGYCLGMALELALACDFRIAAERTRLGLPEARLGIIPDVGGTVRLVKAGRSIARQGSDHDWPQYRAVSRQWNGGLSTSVFPKAELDQGVSDFVEALSASAPLAVSYAKRVVNDIADNARVDSISKLGRRPSYSVAKTFASAVQAMIDKTYPIEWDGK